MQMAKNADDSDTINMVISKMCCVNNVEHGRERRGCAHKEKGPECPERKI